MPADGRLVASTDGEQAISADQAVDCAPHGECEEAEADANSNKENKHNNIARRQQSIIAESVGVNAIEHVPSPLVVAAKERWGVAAVRADGVAATRS